MWLNFDDKSQWHRHYYIKELAQTKDGAFVIPLMWYTKDGEYCADVFSVTYDKEVSSVSNTTAEEALTQYIYSAVTSRLTTANLSPSKPRTCGGTYWIFKPVDMTLSSQVTFRHTLGLRVTDPESVKQCVALSGKAPCLTLSAIPITFRNSPCSACTGQTMSPEIKPRCTTPIQTST